MKINVISSKQCFEKREMKQHKRKTNLPAIPKNKKKMMGKSFFFFFLHFFVPILILILILILLLFLLLLLLFLFLILFQASWEQQIVRKNKNHQNHMLFAWLHTKNSFLL